MSQVTEQSVRFQTALASIKLIQASAVLDLTEDDFDFLTSKDRKSGSAGMPRPSSYAVFCLKKKIDFRKVVLNAGSEGSRRSMEDESPRLRVTHLDRQTGCTT